MVFWANLCVNRHHRLCGVARHASAQWFDFLDLDQKSAFVNWNLFEIRCLQFFVSGLSGLG
jgi:hypothetical protein